jgi:hypothetical protein
MLISDDQIEAYVKEPGQYSINDIKVLRGEGEWLPWNKQSGPTCGIYALDAAFQIRGQMIAPRKRLLPPEKREGQVSIRRRAKEKKLTQIGEIGSVQDLYTLAAAVGIQPVGIASFQSEGQLWEIVRKAVTSGHGIVMPYACADDFGTPAWYMDASGFAHWCLVFGYAVFDPRSHFNRVYNRVFMTTYGQYHEIGHRPMFKSNQCIQDWPQQIWVKVTLWYKEPGDSPWAIWKSDWFSERTVAHDIKSLANGTEAGVGFGIGDSHQVLHKLLDPPNPKNLAFETVLQRAISKREDLKKVEYTKTLRGQCLVV